MQNDVAVIEKHLKPCKRANYPILGDFFLFVPTFTSLPFGIDKLFKEILLCMFNFFNLT